MNDERDIDADEERERDAAEDEANRLLVLDFLYAIKSAATRLHSDAISLDRRSLLIAAQTITLAADCAIRQHEDVPLITDEAVQTEDVAKVTEIGKQGARLTIDLLGEYTPVERDQLIGFIETATNILNRVLGCAVKVNLEANHFSAVTLEAALKIRLRNRDSEAIDELSTTIERKVSDALSN